MKRRLGNMVAGLLLTGLSTLRADQTIQSVQQALKDQGFYYGEVSGEKNADTGAAIRRYQIRKGLQITGELNPETLRLLGAGSSTPSSGVSHAPATTPPPAAASDSPHLPASDSYGAATASSSSSQPPVSSPGYAYGLSTPSVETSRIFVGTPYERAPVELQMRIIAQTQTRLLRGGYYRSGIDGVYGPATAVAVYSFQSRAGILPSGQLDMGTLTALGLAPREEWQGIDAAQWDYEQGHPGDKGFKLGKGKWKIKKHHHRWRLF
jgi:peptidoglycan hydrolase-like protein with peptidoglycan-binding domain